MKDLQHHAQQRLSMLRQFSPKTTKVSGDTSCKFLMRDTSPKQLKLRGKENIQMFSLSKYSTDKVQTLWKKNHSMLSNALEWKKSHPSLFNFHLKNVISTRLLNFKVITDIKIVIISDVYNRGVTIWMEVVYHLLDGPVCWWRKFITQTPFLATVTRQTHKEIQWLPLSHPQSKISRYVSFYISHRVV